MGGCGSRVEVEMIGAGWVKWVGEMGYQVGIERAGM